MIEIKPEFKSKPIRSFVIRGGRITDGQRAAFNSWWPQYGMSLHAGKFDATGQFGKAQPLVVEVGFGMGDSLVAMAEANPSANFVGIEVHPPGVGRLLHNAGRLQLDNLRVYMADAVDVLTDCFDEACIDRLQLYFPDPWHKKKHHKRRIVQPEFVNLVSSRLKPGGYLHMATDWHEYAEHMLAVLNGCAQLRNTAQEFAVKPEFRPATKFERRGELLGHGVWDLLFEKLPEASTER